MNIVNIEALIAQEKIVALADITPTESYVQIGVFQNGNRKNGSSNANAYAPFVIPISELAGIGAIPITLGVIPKGTGPTITDGNWRFAADDLIPLISSSNIGNDLYRVGTLFMSGAIIDYNARLDWVNGVNTRMSLTTAGNLGIGIVAPTARLHVKGSTSDNTAYAYKVDDLAGTNLFNIGNDGKVNVNGGAAIGSTFSVRQNGGTRAFDVYNTSASKQLMLAEDNGVTGGVALAAALVNIDAYGGGVGINIGAPNAASGIKLRVTRSTPGADTIAIDGFASGGFYIRDTANNPYVYMQDSTALTKVQINTGGDSYFNGGKMSMTALPTSNAGLSTGDFYVDTAANILANGDKIVGWKV